MIHTIAEKTVEGGPTLRLFKVPDNVRNLKIQFVPKNDAITDARGIYQLKDGYKYYSFVDSIGLHSGSRVLLKDEQWIQQQQIIKSLL